MKYVDWTKVYQNNWWTQSTSTSNEYYDEYKRWATKNVIRYIKTPSPPKCEPEKFLSDDLDKILEVKSE